MKKIAQKLFIGLVVLSFCQCLYAQTQLTVYTSIEVEFLNDYKTTFEQQHPEITINWVRDSTGIITARLLAEKAAPKADIVFGVAASSLLILEEENLIESYTPQGYELLSDDMRDMRENPKWVGINAWATALCINTFEMKKHRLPYPKTWEDLTKPIYKNQIIAPHPVSSGTGFMNLTAWLQIFGEDEGWSYIEALHKNIKQYSHSGTKPCSIAAQGEAAIALSSSSFAHTLIKKKAPITILIPDDGIGWEMEAVGIIKGTKNLVAAKKLMDFATSDDVAKIGQRFSGITARPEFLTEEGKISMAKMVNNDFLWAAQNRERIINTWRKKFEQ